MRRFILLTIVCITGIALGQSVTGYAYKQDNPNVQLKHFFGITESHPLDYTTKYVASGFYYGLGQSGVVGLDEDESEILLENHDFSTDCYYKKTEINKLTLKNCVIKTGT